MGAKKGEMANLICGFFSWDPWYECQYEKWNLEESPGQVGQWRDAEENRAMLQEDLFSQCIIDRVTKPQERRQWNKIKLEETANKKLKAFQKVIDNLGIAIMAEWFQKLSELRGQHTHKYTHKHTPPPPSNI